MDLSSLTARSIPSRRVLNSLSGFDALARSPRAIPLMAAYILSIQEDSGSPGCSRTGTQFFKKEGSSASPIRTGIIRFLESAQVRWRATCNSRSCHRPIRFFGPTTMTKHLASSKAPWISSTRIWPGLGLFKSVQIDTPLLSKDSDSLLAQGLASDEYEMNILDTCFSTLEGYRTRICCFFPTVGPPAILAVQTTPYNGLRSPTSLILAGGKIDFAI